jgi:hypothetical protein
MELQRYTPTTEPKIFFAPDKGGAWVKHDDIKHLLSRSPSNAGDAKTSGDGEHCQRCGKSYATYLWHAFPDALWRKVTGKEENGLYCRDCFDAMARDRGIGVLYWTCAEGRFLYAAPEVDTDPKPKEADYD